MGYLLASYFFDACWKINQYFFIYRIKKTVFMFNMSPFIFIIFIFIFIFEKGDKIVNEKFSRFFREK